MRTVVLCAFMLLGCLLPAADEWRIEAGPGAPGSQKLPADALVGAGRLQFTVARLSEDDSESWIELRLVTADGRRFSSADPLRLAPGERRNSDGIGLDAGSWAGEDGPLGGDALASMAAIEVAVHGGGARILAGITVDRIPSSSPAFTVEQRERGLVAVGPWREWRIRLLGGSGCEGGTLDLVDAERRRWPMFLDQPGAPDSAGRWRALGPARWVLRLAPREAPAGPAVLEWADGQRSWRSGVVEVPSEATATSRLPAAAAGALPLPRSPAWSGQALVHDAQGWRLTGRKDLPEALAPVIAWRADWTGFRGPGAPSWIEAEELDRAAAAGVALVDLLPDGLTEEQGPFRFGLSPWTGPEAPWRTPRDLWNDDRPWAAWQAHVREVVARCRASPGLAGWVIGMRRTATGDPQAERLRRVAGALADVVAAIDQRPLVARHMQLADYGRRDPKGAWFAFEDGAAGWTLGPAPWVGPVQYEHGSGSGGEGGSIAAQVPPGQDPRAVGVRVSVDANLHNLDRIELDAALEGGGDAVLYAWVTDQYHRWWQQRLDGLAGDGGWQTVGVDFSENGAWTSPTPGGVWNADLRRRIRAFGVVAYVRGSAPGARLRIDRIRRLGWPRQDLAPLAITALQPCDAIAKWTPITTSFRISRDALNPYDPDEADVVGEIEGPDGSKRTHPAFWYEPYRLETTQDTEHAIPDGAGCWRWRWTPPASGTWRWRLVARIKDRDAWSRAETPWQTTRVGDQPGGPVPVRVDPKDHRWFSDAEGRFWFPIGINLRSPGDTRQNNDLERERAYAGGGPARITGGEDVRFWQSSDWERRGTRTYERWFGLMKANGMDWARVWMCPWWCGLEWRRDWDEFGGLVWYNQANAARMDRVVELAAANGVRLQVELMNHGMVGEHADRQWQDSPYNRSNGGPCRSAGEWFRLDEVWKINEKRLRYTIARWGASPTIAAWSLCSELEWTSTFRQEAGDDDRGHSPSVERWTKRELGWLREHEVFPDRPATIHFSHPWSDPELWRIDGLGFSNSNAYTAFQDFDATLGKGRRVPRNLALALESYLDDLFPPNELKRPTLIGEWGGHWADNSPWLLRGELRTGVWLQACTPYAGDTGFWWWLWIDAADRWQDFAGVAAFIRGEDPRGVEWKRIEPAVRSTGSRILAQGMATADRMRLYCWPRGFDQDIRRTAREATGTITIADVAPGSRWEAVRFDCNAGTPVATTQLTADAAGALILPVAGLDPDAAFKLRRLP